MAEKKKCTSAQLALAWVHHQGDDNIGALSVKLTAQEMAELEAMGRPDIVKGERSATYIVTYKNSETPPLSSWKTA
ncbi:hypothetical protein BRARA_I05190 [Brassica rapa]|uniref:NADP-dependent oxidoreductase domain-containing protein n=1 Tax=Brassica campestris TaxID=3711 RepID=A0A397YFM5_BRACM|nr:hypothetical protein BRARA_I05190 [Brassica rapa]